ncbi:MAG TPA: DUF2309 domain-containing protein [Bacteroidia bacterium]|nr:DUF2309 domain-containing protein [Bacteroidia bacterium]
MKTHDSVFEVQETEQKSVSFNEHDVLHELKHFLPAQAPLKDFIHHNTLHAFQNLKFEKATHNASEIFGYKVSLPLNEFRLLYDNGKIRKDILEKIITERKGEANVAKWLERLTTKPYDTMGNPRIGLLRLNWKKVYHVDLDLSIQPILFRILCSYLDQGISMWNFPVQDKGFLSSIKELERNSFTSFFKTERVRNLLLHGDYDISSLLKIIVGDESLYKQYLFDQQFAHQGWAGMVATVEDQPQTLLDTKKISLKDLIIFELLLEIDLLDDKFGKIWAPLATRIESKPVDIFAEVAETELSEVMVIWQNAYEWTYYNQVLAGIKIAPANKNTYTIKSFQAAFCIDDRECSIRRYLEKLDPACETFGTPGFFGVEFYFQPEHGKFYTKLCPAPVTPKYLIKELGTKAKKETDVLFTKHTHSLVRGWFVSQTIGFWSAFKLMISIFRPKESPTMVSSFEHMDPVSTLTIENKNITDIENSLQIGFTIEEMANRVEGQLRSIALIKDFAPVVYLIGHGASSVNNTYYAGYDCGACSGRPGSVNSRVMSFMTNHVKVREVLATRGLVIPEETQFLGGLHDTTRDEIAFYDEKTLSAKNLEIHKKNQAIFAKALDLNSKERSRRFESISTKQTPEKIHSKIKTRSVSLFEPRPEYNHATNTLCIIGRRALTKSLFLDRRAFMNSYDYSTDLDGKLLFGIMKPIGPVCGGINLEYFFSRVDNQKLGAGTKLPHNVMGLFGVANGTDGDLRPGLPSQMIEIHDPLRLLVIVEHFPEVVLQTIQKLPEMYEWFVNEWVHLVAMNPETKEFYLIKDGAFSLYQPLNENIDKVTDTEVIETSQENLPIYTLN